MSLDNTHSSGGSYRDSGNYALVDSLGVDNKEDFFLSKISLSRALKTLDEREKRLYIYAIIKDYHKQKLPQY